MAHRTKTIPLLLDCPGTVGDGGTTMIQGIPFAPGELAAGRAVRIRDATGRISPTQSTPLATWDLVRYRGGYARIIGADPEYLHS